MLDTYKLKGLRERLVKELEGKGINDVLVLDAIRSCPRHYFVESAFSEVAYQDKALPIDEDQTISQPYTVAFQSQLLKLKKGAKVLEIGTGSGYQAAILCQMGIKLFSIERIRQLHHKAHAILSDMGYKPRLKWGDGTAGWEMYAPYDGIIVTAASPSIPETFKKQLAIGGRLVIPVGDLESQTMCCVTRIDQNEFRIEKLESFKFVPMIGKYGWKAEKR